jgi:hypothetical protein
MNTERKRRPQKSWIEQIEQRVSRSKVEPSGSPAARAEAQQAISLLFAELRHSRATPSPDRSGWIETLTFLSETGAFPELESLVFGLQALDRGDVTTGLDRIPMPGPKTRREQYEAMRAAVEAAEEIQREWTDHEAFRAYLKQLGTAYSTIDGYKGKLASQAPAYAPRSSYMLAWGDTDPNELLGLACKAIDAFTKRKSGKDK